MEQFLPSLAPGIAVSTDGRSAGVSLRSDRGYRVLSKLDAEADATPSEDWIPAPPARVLLVDDNDDLRYVMTLMLESNGLRVTACGDAAEAEHAFESQGGCDLLLTDLQMPGRSGDALAETLVARCPSLPVMIVSGSNPSATALESFARRGWTFLSKPFETPHLLARVQALLEFRSPLQATEMPALPRKTISASETAAEGTTGEGQVAQAPEIPVTPGHDKGHVLLLGEDPVLQSTRDSILSRAGYRTTRHRGSELPASFDFSRFALVLICRTIHANDALQLAAAVHAQVPQLPILRIADWDAAPLGNMVFCFGIPTPGYLLAEIGRLVTAFQQGALQVPSNSRRALPLLGRPRAAHDLEPSPQSGMSAVSAFLH